MNNPTALSNESLAQSWIERFSGYIKDDYERTQQRFENLVLVRGKNSFSDAALVGVDMSERTCIEIERDRVKPYLEEENISLGLEYGVVQTYAQEVALGNIAVINELAGYETAYQEQFDALLQ